jgi:hypothetical protein
MTIETKYNIGDYVWVEWFTTPTKMVVESLLFVKDAEIEKIMYSVANPNDRREFFDAEESALFPTKEELLKSL